MTTSPNELRYVSGWSSIAVRDLLSFYDICLIQEHWLHDQLHLLNIDDDFHSVAVSGMDSSTLLPGRPFGGCAILYRKSLSSLISRLTSFKRFCAVMITESDGTYFYPPNLHLSSV